ncbi:MAG: hypothetical protein Q4E47_02160 [Candidatus Saccharibacteria bacterium]|nr:hypothetical protein [Candidatus Saccharibacteria bacterium]
MSKTLSLYKVLLIELLEKSIRYDKAAVDTLECTRLLRAYSQYIDSDKNPPEYPPAARDLFCLQEPDLKECLFRAETILRDSYGYGIGFQSLIKSLRRLERETKEAQFALDDIKERFRKFLYDNSSDKLGDFMVSAYHVDCEATVNEIVDKLTQPNFYKKNESWYEAVERRKYFLNVLESIGPGQRPPTLMELESGFNARYHSILRDCALKGVFKEDESA